MELICYVDTKKNEIVNLNSNYYSEVEILNGNKILIKKNKYIDKAFYNTSNNQKQLNYTAVVGKNNSGKTTLIKNIFNEEGLIIYKSIEKKETIFFNKGSKEDWSIIYEDKNYELTEENNNRALEIFFSNSMESQYVVNNKKIKVPKFGYDFTNNLTMMNELNLSSNFTNFLEEEIKRQINYILENDTNTNLNEMMNNTENELNVPHLIEFKSGKIHSHNIDVIERVIDTFFKEENQEVKKIFDLLTVKSNNLFKDEMEKIVHSIFMEDLLRQKGYTEAISKIRNCIIKDSRLEVEKNNEYYEFQRLNESYRILDLLSTDSFNNVDVKNNEKFFKSVLISDREIELEKNSFNSEVIPSYVELPVDYAWKEMSSGQFYIISFLSRIFESSKKIKLINEKVELIVIELDEIDLGLHPEWQRKWINYIPKILSDIFFDYNLHIILTTHSPIILSDLRKEDIVYLQNREQVYLDTQTFGANIHELMSESFFLKGGLVGEFSKNKIKGLFEELSKPDYIEIERLTELENIINQIGEAIIRNELISLLNEKKDNTELIPGNLKEREIEKLLKKVQVLQKELGHEKNTY